MAWRLSPPSAARSALSTVRWAGLALALAVALALVRAPALAAGDPRPAAAFLLPPQALAFDVGGTLDLDGVPTAMAGFVTRHSPAVVAAWVRERWPRDHTDDRVGVRRVLGRIDGHRHLTLVLQPTPDGGTRGLWASADLRAALRAADRPSRARWLPAGSEVLQRLAARDAGGDATTWLVRHGSSPAAVADHLARRLAADRMALQQRLQPAGDVADAHLLVFAGPGGRALAAIAPLPGGGSATALTVTQPQAGR